VNAKMRKTPYPTPIDHAYEAGRQARRAGRRKLSNPHAGKDPTLFVAWRDGWEEEKTG
jgi:hypothetical protein